MRKRSYWKHENSTDLVVEPIRIIYINSKPKRIKVKAILYTCAYPGKLIMQDVCEWDILDTEIHKWKPYAK